MSLIWVAWRNGLNDTNQNVDLQCRVDGTDGNVERYMVQIKD